MPRFLKALCRWPSISIGWDAQETNTMSISGVLLYTNTPAATTNNIWRVRSVP